MASYFKYAERNVDSQINWSEIGKNVVDMLREEDRLREEKKSAIDEASREFGETLANAPTGQFKSANEWILGYAADASQARLMQDRLLKSGLLKVKDYTVMRQNLNDGTNQMFQVAKEYQDKAKEAMERYQLKESQETEAWLMEQIQGLSNFKNTKAYINPTNFTVSLAGMKKQVIDGKEVMVMETDPNKYMSVNQLRNRLDVRLDRYKYVDAIDAQVESLGDFQTADITKVAGLYKMASVKEVLDPTNRTRLSDEAKSAVTAYQQWEQGMITAELAIGYNQLSILTDAVDKVPGTQDFYTPTFSEEEARSNPKFILLKDNGSGMIEPVFTEEQTKAATEFLRAQTRNALDRKVSIQAASEQQPYPMQQWQYEAGQEGNKDKEIANLIGTLYYGNDNDVDAALEYFRDFVPNAKKLTRTNNGVVVLFNNGEERDVSFKNENGSIKSLEMFIKGAGPLLAGQADINTALKRGGYRKGAQFSTLSSDRVKEVTGVAKTTNVQDEFNSYVTSFMSAEKIKGFKDKEDSAVEYFNDILQILPGLTGYTAEGDGSLDLTSDGVLIKNPEGKNVLTFSFDGKYNPLNYIEKLRKLSSEKTAATEKQEYADKYRQMKKAQEERQKKEEQKIKTAPGTGELDK